MLQLNERHQAASGPKCRQSNWVEEHQSYFMAFPKGKKNRQNNFKIMCSQRRQYEYYISYITFHNITQTATAKRHSQFFQLQNGGFFFHLFFFILLITIVALHFLGALKCDVVFFVSQSKTVFEPNNISKNRIDNQVMIYTFY